MKNILPPPPHTFLFLTNNFNKFVKSLFHTYFFCSLPPYIQMRMFVKWHLAPCFTCLIAIPLGSDNHNVGKAGPWAAGHEVLTSPDTPLLEL